MIRIASEKDLVESFRPIEREEVQISQALKFPMIIKDYLSWEEPSGNRTFLVLEDFSKRQPLGIVFRKDSGSLTVSSMCEWCHSVRSKNGIKLLTATASSNRRVGIYVCSDLSCKEKAENPPGPDDIPQMLDSRAKIRKITKRMTEFAKKNLF